MKINEFNNLLNNAGKKVVDDIEHPEKMLSDIRSIMNDCSIEEIVPFSAAYLIWIFSDMCQRRFKFNFMSVFQSDFDKVFEYFESDIQAAEHIIQLSQPLNIWLQSLNNEVPEGFKNLDEDQMIDTAMDIYDELNEGIKDSIYANNMKKLSKEYSTKLKALQQGKERKLAAIREQKNRKIATCKTETEGAKVRETIEAKMQAVRDQYDAAKENLKNWRDKQAEANRLKKEKGMFNKERREAKKDAKQWKNISKKSTSSANSSRIK